MAENRHEAIVSIAREVHGLVKEPGILDLYVQNIREWIDARRIEDQEREKRNRPLLQQLLGGEDPDQAPEAADFNGPAPLYEGPPWLPQQCYVATAVIHDALVADLRGQSIDAVEPICPAGSEYRRFQLLTVRDEGGRFFNEAELLEGPLREALERVRDNLAAAGLVEAAGQTGGGRESVTELLEFDVVRELLDIGARRLQNVSSEWRTAGAVVNWPTRYATIRPLIVAKWPQKAVLFPESFAEFQGILAAHKVSRA